jgi:cholesterol oxidase
MADTHFDAVVVGSGFGGSVMAYRLVQAGLRVCLLERGKAFPPGSFPRAPYALGKNFWDPKQGLFGMYHVWQFNRLNALAASGLGGGSLIYANVLIRKDEKWFVHDHHEGAFEHWPVTRQDLDPHYDEVERHVGVEVYPRHLVQITPKTREYADAAKRAGLDHACLPLAVAFSKEGQPNGEPINANNLHGQTRNTCRLCGECDVGCNYGSKNSLDFTYLSEAKRLGLHIVTGADVRTFQPRAEGGFSVDYVQHSFESNGTPDGAPRTKISCGQLILSAGAMGSTHLMLKNKANLKGELPKLGSQFCGNGDILGMAIKTKTADGKARLIDPNRGPVITSRVRLPDALDGGDIKGRGAYIEDAGFPAFLSWVTESYASVTKLDRVLGFIWRMIKSRYNKSGDTDLSAEISDLLGGNELTMSALPMLGMGRDLPDGKLLLNDESQLESTWSEASSNAYFERVRDHMKILAHEMGGRFVDNPMWLWKRLITVHALGGCPMGRHKDEGVVDDHGEVFGTPGLFVADGSVMPGPVGPNPSLTIAALADRFADRVIENHKKGAVA